MVEVPLLVRLYLSSTRFDRAIIVGARSFGKGLVQRPLKLTYGTQLKVTISRYYTPSGRCIQALDYRNRDEQGKAIQTTNIHQFKTKMVVQFMMEAVYFLI